MKVKKEFIYCWSRFWNKVKRNMHAIRNENLGLFFVFVEVGSFGEDINEELWKRVPRGHFIKNVTSWSAEQKIVGSVY